MFLILHLVGSEMYFPLFWKESLVFVSEHNNSTRSVGMLKTRQLSGFMFKLIVLTVLLTKITRNKVNIAC